MDRRRQQQEDHRCIIPADVLLDVALHLLDARDLVVLVEARLLPLPPPPTSGADAAADADAWPKGAAFVARRVLSPAELRWFTARRIPVVLPPVQRLSDQIYVPDVVDGRVDDFLFPKYQWTLKHTGVLHRDFDLPAVVWGHAAVFPLLEEWWHEGKLHRDCDRPATIRAGDTNSAGCTWWVDGRRHRDGGRPAAIFATGWTEFWVNGQRHRDGGRPAVVYSNGAREYWVNGQRHRDGGRPAVVHPNGARQFWVNGQRHRDGGRPAVVHPAGAREYWVHGRVHRDGGRPAIVGADPRQFWVNGQRHRWCGPAVVWSDGSGDWYWFGVSLRPAANAMCGVMHGLGLSCMNAGLIHGCTPNFVLDMAMGGAIVAVAHLCGGHCCAVFGVRMTQFNVLMVCALMNAIGVALALLVAAAARLCPAN